MDILGDSQNYYYATATEDIGGGDFLVNSASPLGIEVHFWQYEPNTKPDGMALHSAPKGELVKCLKPSALPNGSYCFIP